tara:strand:+ start:982 stop:1800 length:819 start_codon:yes stop_codon:yes gene_type:complete
MKKNILLLDGYNLIYRARYSGMNKGEYSTIFNFFRGIRPLIEKFNPDFAYLVLEGMPKKRLEVQPDYKGQRTYDDKDNFRFQRKTIVSLLEKYFPIQLVKHDDYECDDIIGHISNLHKAKGDSVTIISSDTDFIQCIDDNVMLYNPVRKSYIEKPSYDYVLWKSLKGDASDNIQGFKGIGDKRAQKLCENKNELAKFIELDKNKSKLQENMFMIKLHDLKEDAENINFFDMPKQPCWDDLKNVFEQYEFSSIISKEKTWHKYTNTFNKLFER